VTRLDTIVNRTAILSISSRALADSLGLTLAAVTSQSLQQQRVLASLRAGAAVQAVQVRDQQRLMAAQQRMMSEGWRQSFPLETPIGVFAAIEYQADSVGVGAFLDSLGTWSRSAAAHTRPDTTGRIRDAQGRITSRFWDTDRNLEVRYHVEAGRVVPDEVTVIRNAELLRNWPDRVARDFLLNGTIEVTINSPRADPPLELRFFAEPDTANALFQLDRHLSPTSPYRVTADLGRRTVQQQFAVRAAEIIFRNVNLSVLDLPCSTVALRTQGDWEPNYARITAAEIFFGYSESQWQLKVPADHLKKAPHRQWEATVHSDDLFQSIWGDYGWTRYDGLSAFLRGVRGAC